MNEKGRKVKCHNCGHTWTTYSDAQNPTCPSCRLKIIPEGKNKAITRR